MKKVVLASLLAVAGAGPLAHFGFAQTAPATAPAGGQVQMSQEEYAAYNNANTQATPAAKAAAFEAYLKAYPQSSVKADVLQQLLLAYSQTGDAAKTLDAADRLLQVDPTNLRALTFETYTRRSTADALTDPAAKTAALDAVAGYAQKGLTAPKPAGMSDDDFKKLQASANQVLQSAIADDDLAKKDNAGAIAALKADIDAAPIEQTKTGSPVLQDIYTLAQAYYTSTPPDFINCTWYATRAAIYAPDAYKPQIQPLATYCYKKYHGKVDGYDAVVAAAKDNLNPPAGFTITPAPSPADIVSNLIATTPDLAALAISDKEYVLQNGKQADADKVFDTIKGKSVVLPDVTVIAVTADSVQVAVSDDAVQSKTADFAFNFAAGLKVPPTVGEKVTLTGTYASYTQTPLLITMSDSVIVEKKKAVVRHVTPVHKKS